MIETTEYVAITRDDIQTELCTLQVKCSWSFFGNKYGTNNLFRPKVMNNERILLTHVIRRIKRNENCSAIKLKPELSLEEFFRYRGRTFMQFKPSLYTL